jgi:hypothetical protein
MRMGDVYKWQFAPRFRRNAFGWRSDTPRQRIKEALAEIKQVARKDPILAAEGMVLLLEKLAPALEQVDSSSGAIGSAVNKVIETAVPLVAKAAVEQPVRQRWLERLWQALQDDDMPYIEYLGDFWGELCVTPELAAVWVDEFLPVVELVWNPQAGKGAYFKGTTACLASLLTAGRYEQLLDLIERAPFQWWHNRRWGVKALAALGRKAEAIRYAEDSRGLNTPDWQIAQACEEILLSSGMADEAYQRYAIAANQGTTYLATFRAIAKKYPHKTRDQLLRDLIASTPGAEGKWFAAAKEAGLFAEAIELVGNSPTDPRVLIRAAKEYGVSQPAFALASGMAALRWIAKGQGYEITSADVMDAYEALLQAAPQAGITSKQLALQLQQLLAEPAPYADFLHKFLAHRLAAQ